MLYLYFAVSMDVLYLLSNKKLINTNEVLFTVRNVVAEGNIYHPQQSWGKVIFLHVSVILFMGGLPHCMLGYNLPPQGPEAGTPPPEQTPTQDKKQAPRQGPAPQEHTPP